MSHTKGQFLITREFKANIETVFNAFSNAKALTAWWGPVGMPTTVITFDFKPGGKFHYKLEGNGQVMWGLFVYQKITSPKIIEYVSSFADEEGNICQDPFGIGFPLEVFNQITFEEINNATVLTLKAYPLNATREQEATFESMNASLNQGYTGTLNQLEVYLGK